MMEAKPIEFLPAGVGESSELRRLEWAELVARLAASRDFRAGWRDARQSMVGNFAEFANRPANHRESKVNAETDSVNHAGSGHGKTERAKTQEAVEPAACTDGSGD